MDREQRLAEIEAREKAATPGPWTVDLGEKFSATVFFINCGKCSPEEDACFIREARSDIPWLVARVKRLEEALERIREPQLDAIERPLSDADALDKIDAIASEALEGE